MLNKIIKAVKSFFVKSSSEALELVKEIIILDVVENSHKVITLTESKVNGQSVGFYITTLEKTTNKEFSVFRKHPAPALGYFLFEKNLMTLENNA